MSGAAIHPTLAASAAGGGKAVEIDLIEARV
jgi:hypothetical protein